MVELYCSSRLYSHGLGVIAVKTVLTIPSILISAVFVSYPISCSSVHGHIYPSYDTKCDNKVFHFSNCCSSGVNLDLTPHPTRQASTSEDDLLRPELRCRF